MPIQRSIAIFLMTLLVAATWLVIPCQAQQPTTKWAIAIHGGAGGTPDKWSQEKRDKRVEGLRDALKAGKQRLENGDSAVDVVQSVIEMLEDNPMFNAGRGAVKNTDNSCQLDASIMDGRTKSCGGVAAVTTVRNPIGLARIVMEKTRHVLMVGPGAERLAEQYRLPIVDNSYFLSRDVRPGHPEMYFGTVGCVVRDAKGNLAAGTSTGGTSKKLPGRVGDSPIIGAGTYADNASCAVSCTGTGEEYIRNAIAYDISAAMRYRRTDLRSATENAIHQTLQRNSGGLIAVDHLGNISLQHNSPAMSFAAANSEGRFEVGLAVPGQPGVLAATPTNDADASAVSTVESSIRSVLDDQVRAWNNGDIPGFMRGYWESPQLSFASGGTMTSGWAATMQRYKRRYTDAKTMGTLQFDDLSVHPFGTQHAYVTGQWTLTRENDKPRGRFTLLFQKMPIGWRIIHDHTSAAETPE